MGGFGSGTWIRVARKTATDELPTLEVGDLKREGLIVPGQEELIVAERLKLRISWTPCNFGGARPWFVCPGEDCGRRAAILYLKGGHLLCRLCLDLTYPSQREDALERAKRRAEKARARLGPDAEPRKKGMHRRTFENLAREYLEARREHVVLHNEWAAKLSEQFSRKPPGSL